MESIEDRIIKTIDKIKPFLMEDGGFIDFIRYEDGIAYVKLSGACANCSLIDYTLKEGIELTLTSEVPEVVEVINIR